jgi:hypothetical protein
LTVLLKVLKYQAGETVKLLGKEVAPVVTSLWGLGFSKNTDSGGERGSSAAFSGAILRLGKRIKLQLFPLLPARNRSLHPK